MTLQPHQQRVVDEKKELDEKLNKLREFFGMPIYLKLDLDERNRLLDQSEVMGQYSQILSKRIAAFK